MHTDDRYLRAAAASGFGVWDWNLVTGELYADPVFKEMLGFTDQELRDRADDWLRLVHPEDAAAVRERLEAHLRGETPLYESEYRLAHRDGSIRWFHARGSVTRNEQGTPVLLSGTATDITERKRSEEALRQAQEINRRIVDCTGDCVEDSRPRGPSSLHQSGGAPPTGDLGRSRAAQSSARGVLRG